MSTTWPDPQRSYWDRRRREHREVKARAERLELEDAGQLALDLEPAPVTASDTEAPPVTAEQVAVFD